MPYRKVLGLLLIAWMLLLVGACATPQPPIPPPAADAPGAPAPSPSPQPAPTPSPEPAATPLPEAKTLAVHFIDVGQGDAILLLVQPGATVLIDGGPRAAGQTVVNYLTERGVKELDLVIATHPHADHIGGLIDVLEAFKVKRVIDSGQPHTTKTFDDYLTAVERQVEAGHCVYETPEGQIVQLASNVTLKVLGPDRDLSSLNDNSVVARVDFGKTSFLFTGDAEKEAEERLLARGVDLKADVLKVGHHGSSTSTSAAFLAAVAPAYAVICVGAGNSYGHPTEQTLNRLAAAGARIYRTDVSGHVVFTSDGTTLTTAAAAWAAPAPQPPASQGMFVGSKKSDKYHWPTCRHAKTIRPENEIWFESAEAARKAGYTPCGVCRPPTK